jgi:hypothetical protein
MSTICRDPCPQNHLRDPQTAHGKRGCRQVEGSFLAGRSSACASWPILSVLVGLILALGLVAGFLEGCQCRSRLLRLVSGLTIGYGDLAPKTFPARAGDLSGSAAW